MVAAAPLLADFDDLVEIDEANLVIEDDAPVDSIFSEKQQRLLTETLYSSWSGPPPGEDGAARPFVALANVGLFSSLSEPPIVPDMMLSLDVAIPEDQREKKNRSYFMWRYGKAPELALEIVSNRDGAELGAKLQRYARIGVDYYVVHDPLQVLGKVTVRGFARHEGKYVEMIELWFERLGLGLVVWEGVFEGMAARWLRWRTRDGKLVQTGAERASILEERARRLAERLRALGVDPDTDD